MSKAKCLNCNDIVESKSVHDWQCCSCFTKSRNLCDTFCNQLNKEITNDTDAELYIKAVMLFSELTHRGFYLDGGGEYCRCGGNLADIQWLSEDEG